VTDGISCFELKIKCNIHMKNAVFEELNAGLTYGFDAKNRIFRQF